MTALVTIGILLAVIAVLMAIRSTKRERSGAANNWTNDRHLKKKLPGGDAGDNWNVADTHDSVGGSD